jgi:hypothetical protein
MSPRRPRRRARRRTPARPVILLIGAAVVIALLVGGLSQVSRQSRGYDANSNRSLAAEGAVVVEQSNATSDQVRNLVAAVPGETRQSLQVALDSAVQQTASESARAALAAGAAASSAEAAEFASVFAERAQSVADLRAALDGFLGMGPLPAAGSSAAAEDGPSSTGTAQLSATQAANRIAAAGALLSRADSLYRSVRAALASAVGHARLPDSVWVTDTQQWQLGTVAVQVDLMATSPTLVASHYVVLRTVRLSPSALPTPQGTPSGISVLSPTSQLGVTTVVANEGSVDEPRVSVRFLLANSTSGGTATQVERVAVSAGASVTMPTVNFRVKPGAGYVLTVAMTPPAGQSNTLGTALQQVLQIAPAT